ncbi:MAG: endolytic transglycosylase MltG [Pseudonocardia sp.]|uniref:endolytic transglycosylase MltG n=1 Tax=Pseudonocardia sp. TaxID=60912 RepID=UPI001ACF4DC2|nr:endolytic transglycosylase MltG [Pseudonocardia sp.]MBN9102964.1 endolytic transglycosylase MltG [Pseudonocardia sp.]
MVSDPTVRLKAVGNRGDARRARRRQGRRKRFGVLALAVLLLLGTVAGGGYYVYTSFFATPDFDGTGEGSVLVQVEDGDTTSQIATELTQKGVVESAAAFKEAAADNAKVRSVQPGFYQLKLRMSGASAVALLLDPAARVGQLEIRSGVQLDDTKAPNGAESPGVLSLISAATCVGEGADRKCVSADELRSTMATTDPATLGVPAWALDAVAKADPKRRLEGLIAPGRYNVQPGATPLEVLQSIMAISTARIEATGLVSGAQSIGSSPYQVLVIASMVEKEAIIADMPKVARVIYNRLGSGQRLELDTTINYPLDVQSLLTSPQNRAIPGPYNTYLTPGLPPTPIATPGSDAVAAALTPASGPWLFFVPCKKDGTSCFAVTFAEHSANVALAQKNGVF